MTATGPSGRPHNWSISPMGTYFIVGWCLNKSYSSSLYIANSQIQLRNLAVSIVRGSGSVASPSLRPPPPQLSLPNADTQYFIIIIFFCFHLVAKKSIQSQTTVQSPFLPRHYQQPPNSTRNSRCSIRWHCPVRRGSSSGGGVRSWCRSPRCWCRTRPPGSSRRSPWPCRWTPPPRLPPSAQTSPWTPDCAPARTPRPPPSSPPGESPNHWARREVFRDCPTNWENKEEGAHLLFPINMITMFELECWRASSSQVVRWLNVSRRVMSYTSSAPAAPR